MQDLTGRVFGDWTVLEMCPPEYSPSGYKIYKAKCQCVCGRIKNVRCCHLTGGRSTSCGCRSAKTRMETIYDLTGKTFGELYVESRAGFHESAGGSKSALWNVRCGCGKMFVSPTHRLTKGEVKRCPQCSIDIHAKHRMSDSRLYNVYKGIKSRCYYDKHHHYKYYGERGIKMCDEWKSNFLAFYNWSIINGYDENAPRGQCTIDRIDPNGDYCPENCRIVTNTEQQNNTRHNIIIEYKDETYTAKQFSEAFNIPYHRVRFWTHDGMTPEEIISRSQQLPYHPQTHRS